jgi:hypothetical protein
MSKERDHHALRQSPPVSVKLTYTLWLRNFVHQVRTLCMEELVDWLVRTSGHESMLCGAMCLKSARRTVRCRKQSLSTKGCEP